MRKNSLQRKRWTVSKHCSSSPCSRLKRSPHQSNYDKLERDSQKITRLCLILMTPSFVWTTPVKFGKRMYAMSSYVNGRNRVLMLPNYCICVLARSSKSLLSVIPWNTVTQDNNQASHRSSTLVRLKHFGQNSFNHWADIDQKVSQGKIISTL